MASYDVEKLVKLAALKALAEKVKAGYVTKTELSTKATELSNRIDEIESVGAEANVINEIKVNGVKQEPIEKAVDITVPTKVGDLTNDKSYQTESDVDSKIKAQISSAYKAAGSVTQSSMPTPSEQNAGNVYNVSEEFTTDENFIEGEQSKTYPAGTNIVVVQVESEYKFDILSGFVDTSNFVTKELGKGLSTKDFTEADKSKLDNLNNYEHPTSESGGSKGVDLYKISTDAEGHVETAEKVTMQDITNLGIPDKDTTYDPATQESNGLMSSEDKKKLDGIEIALDEDVEAMLTEVFDAA